MSHVDDVEAICVELPVSFLFDDGQANKIESIELDKTKPN